MDKANLLKRIVGAISSVLSSMLGILYIPVLLDVYKRQEQVEMTTLL